MKIMIPENLRGKELFNFLIANKDAIVAQKKALPKFTESFVSIPALYGLKDNTAIKTNIGEIPADATSIRVKLVANAAHWLDSQRDVLLADCWAKSIKEKKGRVHLHDHIYRLDAQVGDVSKIYSQETSLTDLGLNKPGTTQCLIYESDVQREYNDFVFKQYKAGKINQHSIGLIYVKIELAINDEEYEKEMDFWDKYYSLIINKEDADELGYFWVVSEIKLLEVSAVLFGSNELTPTLDVSKLSTFAQPSQDTPSKPPGQPKTFDLDSAITQTRFFN